MATKKALTRKWLSQESPTLTTWMDITMDICRMEKSTADVNYKKDLFVLRWKKWMDYITPLRPDFDLSNLRYYAVCVAITRPHSLHVHILIVFIYFFCSFTRKRTFMLTL